MNMKRFVIKERLNPAFKCFQRLPNLDSTWQVDRARAFGEDRELRLQPDDMPIWRQPDGAVRPAGDAATGVIQCANSY
jgi:hypothetical protein